MDQFNFSNIALLTTRRITRLPFDNIFVADTYPEYKVASHDRNTMVFPLYLGSLAQEGTLFADDPSFVDRRHNLNPAFISALEKKLGVNFVPIGQGDLDNTVGPEDVFHYAYAIFHSPTYRIRYGEHLMLDFPRLPLTANKALFKELVDKGARLVDLHLLRLSKGSGVGGRGGSSVLNLPGKQGVSFPKPGTGDIEKVTYASDSSSESGRVWINSEQYFDGIDSATWKVKIGGYQPLDKWLKDRRGLKLQIDDIQHYLRMIVALRQMRSIMEEIDQLVPRWPLS